MKADKKQITSLLATARGQLDGIIKMVEDDRYCIDISNQIMSSQAILSRANKEILKAHVLHCVQNAKGETSKEKLHEITELLDKVL